MLRLCRCSSAETQILKGLNSSNIGSANFDPVVLAEYYLLGQGGTLNAIAKTATGVDLDAVSATIGNVITDTITVSSPASKGLGWSTCSPLAIQGLGGPHAVEWPSKHLLPFMQCIIDYKGNRMLPSVDEIVCMCIASSTTPEHNATNMLQHISFSTQIHVSRTK